MLVNQKLHFLSIYLINLINIEFVMFYAEMPHVLHVQSVGLQHGRIHLGHPFRMQKPWRCFLGLPCAESERVS